MFLKVRMLCIKDYQQVSQERKCHSEAVGYSPWSVSGLLPHLRWELQILALVCCEFWVGVRRSFAEQEAHAVQSSAPQVTVFNPCAPYTVLSWTVRWAKTSALAVNTNQCHEGEWMLCFFQLSRVLGHAVVWCQFLPVMLQSAPTAN